MNTTTTIQPQQPDTVQQQQQKRRVLTHEQLVHRSQMDKRSLDVERKMQHLVAHTVLPGRSRREFSGSFDLLDKAVDVVMTKFWKRLPNGKIRAGTRFCCYKAFWDPETGKITVGGGVNNPFAKDASCRPFVGARGKVFDYSANRTNWETAMLMDRQMEAAARQPNLQVGKPILSTFYLGFDPDNPPAFAATSTLKDDTLNSIILREDEASPLLQYGHDGIITEIERDNDGTAIVQVRTSGGEDKNVLIPSFVRTFPSVAEGNSVRKDDLFGEFELPAAALTTWDAFAKEVGEDEAIILMERQWASKYIVHEAFVANAKKVFYCIPAGYVTPADSRRSKVQLRDTSAIMGRVLHNPEEPGHIDTVSEDEALVQVWSSHGDSSRLVLNEAGVDYNFQDVREGWDRYFDTLSEPK